MEIEELYLFKVQFGVIWPTDRNKYKCPRAKHIKQELPPQEQFVAKQLILICQFSVFHSLRHSDGLEPEARPHLRRERPRGDSGVVLWRRYVNQFYANKKKQCTYYNAYNTTLAHHNTNQKERKIIRLVNAFTISFINV